MYDLFIRSVGYITEFSSFVWASIKAIFAPGQPGFALIVLAAAVVIGKYGCRALQKRNYLRSARILMRTVQGFALLVLCFVAFQVIQAVYPLVVKAVSAIK